MLFGSDRDQLRQMWIDAWQNHKRGQTLIPLHQELVNIIEKHPEYISVLEAAGTALGREYLPEMGETNPFLHMAMHISIQEQLSTKRPTGIEQLYQSMLNKNKDPHATEHLMMECLGKMLWEAQSHNKMPDENDYLDCLKKYI